MYILNEFVDTNITLETLLLSAKSLWEKLFLPLNCVIVLPVFKSKKR
jgi:hypothetical protein